MGMRIIDSEGRVFGLINAIDLGALLLVLLLGVGLFAALQQKDAPPQTETTRQITLTLQLRYPELAPMIAVGDRELVGSTPTATVTNVTDEGQGSTAKVLVDVTLNADEKGRVYTYGNKFGTQYLKVGETFSLDLPKSRVEGLIIALATA